ncbi:MAG: AbrB/MazE/SpoVT family DNA-binding domain-containing protein [Chlorobium sp.]|nr:AbrB/MazE/SpoVT family DNA-binding domain-containing protein [Chlorobium sp.]
MVYTRRNTDTARIFPSGRSQSVRLPKEYRFKGKDIMIKHFDNGVLLLPIDTSWTMLQAALQEFEPGFILKREQPEEQRREEIAAYFPLSG